MNKILAWLKYYFIPHRGNQHQPVFLKARCLFFVFLVVVFLELILVFQFLQVIPTGKMMSSIFTDVLVDLTNQNREEEGLYQLKRNPLLDQAAKLKAEDMASKEYFAHTSPEGVTPWYWFDLVGYDYLYAGENLAVNFFDSSDIDQAWMESPKHKKNIINKNFSEIGIGLANGRYKNKETIFVVQLFGTPKKEVLVKVLPEEPQIIEQEIVPEPEPETVPEPEIIEQEESFVYVAGEEKVFDDQSESKIEYASLMAKTVSSPKKTTTFILYFLLLTLSIALFLKIIIKIKIQFPVLIVDGLMVLTVVLLAFMFNHHVLSLMGQIY
jgi:hypothetical protein